MFVDKFRLRLCWMAARPVVGNQLHIGIFRQNSFCNPFIISKVIFSIVFIPNFKIFQVERLRMSTLGTDASPYRSRRPVGIFNGVQGILNPLSHLIHWRNFLVRNTCIDTVQRFCTKIFGQLQIFIETQSMRGVVSPDIPKRCSCVDISNGIFPVVHVFKIVAFDPTTSGKTQKFRMNGINGIGQIDSQTMIFPCFIGHQRNHIEVEFATALS